MTNPIYIYESPDCGKTIYRRESGKDEREKISTEKSEEMVNKVNDRCENCIYWDSSNIEEDKWMIENYIKNAEYMWTYYKDECNKYEQKFKELLEPGVTKWKNKNRKVVEPYNSIKHQMYKVDDELIELRKSIDPNNITCNCVRFPKYVKRKSIDTCGEFCAET